MRAMLLFIGFLLFFSVSSYAQEEIRITTFYPSPNGSYDQLQAERMGVGDVNNDGVFNSADIPPVGGPANNGFLWVAKQAQIGDNNAAVNAVEIKSPDSYGINFARNNVIRWPSTSGAAGFIELRGDAASSTLTIDPNTVNTNGAVRILGSLQASSVRPTLVAPPAASPANPICLNANGDLANCNGLDINGGSLNMHGWDIGGVGTLTASTAAVSSVTSTTVSATSVTAALGTFTSLGGIVGSSVNVGVGSISGGPIGGTSLNLGAGPITSGTISSGAITSGAISATGTITSSALAVNGAVCSSGGTLVACVSSRKFKTDIQDLDVDVSQVLKLRPVSFKWKDGGQADIGLIAEEVNDTLDNLVTYNKDNEVIGVKYEKIAVYLIKVVQQQQRQIDKLTADVEALKRAK